MTTRCTIKLHAEPVRISLDDLDDSPLDIFFALGVVNPFGPTLTFVAAAGVATEGTTLPLVKVMLNPFSQRVEQIGQFTLGKTWLPRDDLAPLLGLDYGSCPTLLMISGEIDAENRMELATAILATFGDEVVRVWQSVEKHFADPWSRVSKAMVERSARTTAKAASEALGTVEAAQRLASALADPRHIVPELQAFLYAWQGSIEQTGLGSRLKGAAMQAGQFRQFFMDRVVPVVWFPDLTDQTKPKPESPERLKVQDPEDIEQIMRTKAWQGFSEQKLLDLLRALFFVYGVSADPKHIQAISVVYRHAMEGRMEPESRLVLEVEMGRLIDEGKVKPVVFLPFLVMERDMQLVSKATIDFLSASDYQNDELYAITELRNLFKRGGIADRGAMFGALVTMGDSEVLPLAEELKSLLTVDEVRRAAQVHTVFPQHRAIQFWLDWCKDLVTRPADDDQAKFGACASALTLVLQNDQVGKVSAGKRHFPCQESAKPITIEQEWTIEQYAELLAPTLYRLEKQESAPRVFSSVLISWGLQPQAPLTEQLIPPGQGRGRPEQHLRDLSSTAKGKASGGFLSRLFRSRDQN